MHSLHVSRERDLPDAGGGMCCLGAAAGGPGACTCWVPEHDRAQAEPQQGPPPIRSRRCSDCAFRPDSPENRGDDRYDCEGALEALASPNGTFYCHDGLRIATALVHEPTGARVPTTIPDAYDPPTRGALAFKANGTPATICAGFAAARRRHG
jgi:hypothetical protein